MCEESADNEHTARREYVLVLLMLIVLFLTVVSPFVIITRSHERRAVLTHKMMTREQEIRVQLEQENNKDLPDKVKRICDAWAWDARNVPNNGYGQLAADYRFLCNENLQR